MRLVLVSALMLAVAAHAGAAAHRGGPAHVPAAATVVRAEVVSGSGQIVGSYAAPAATKYLADFDRLLTVRIAGGFQGGKRTVHFHCVTPGCVFAPEEQPDGVERGGDDHNDPAAYDATVSEGKAAIRVTLQADVPAGRYVVSAEPVARKGERSVAATFTLTTR